MSTCATRTPWIGQIAGGAAAGLYASLTGVILYSPVSGLFTPLGFLSGTNANFINGCIAMVIGCVVGFVVTYLVCPDPEGKKA